MNLLEQQLEPSGEFPVHEYVQEECDARGWTEEGFIARFQMHGPFPAGQAQFIAEFWLYASSIKGLLMDDDSAETLGKVFGTSAELWKRLHQSHQQWLETHPTHKENDDG
ncbi:MAG: hypothetical protein AAFY08_13010 [Planctomycetota bacterium]